MSDLYDRITRERGSIENMLARIPGFRGYLDREARRDADRMLRNFIASELDRRIDRFARIERKLLDNNGLSYMSRTAATKTRLQTYRDRVSAAAPGYSGFTSALKVGEQELELLYAFDEAQIRYVDRLDAGLETFESAVTSKDGIEAALEGIDALVVEADEAFKLRDDVITNIDQSLR
jgi:hypothetical protein